MRMFSFAPALGQRFIYRQQSLPDENWCITRTYPSLNLHEPPIYELSCDISPLTKRATAVDLAAAMLSGSVVPADLQTKTEERQTTLADLLAQMTVSQRECFIRRVSYVKAVIGLQDARSWKSKDFETAVQATFQLRQLKALKQLGERDAEFQHIEQKAPSPHSVYRWKLAYEQAQCDMRVLAREVLAQRYRKARKPDAVRLLMALLMSRRASTTRTPLSEVHREFNELAKTMEPSNIEDAIRRLHLNVQQTAAGNAAVRKSRRSVNKAKTKARGSAVVYAMT